jgi:signal transduction histidine kinase
MSEPSWEPARIAAVLRSAGVPDEPPARAMLVELWARLPGDAPPAQADLPAAEAAAAAWSEAGASGADVVRRALRLGRALADASPAGALDGAAAARLGALTDEAAARAVEAACRRATERREAWLSFLNHELKNPLNTVLNALWLLREHRDAPNAERFLDLAERAVRKMEAILKDLRDLHRKARTAPPTKGGETPPQKPGGTPAS